MHVYFEGLYIFSCNLCVFYLHIYDVYFACDIYFVLNYALARESSTFVVLRHSCTFLHCIYSHYWSYTSLRLMLFVVKTSRNKAYSILFYSTNLCTKLKAYLHHISSKCLHDILLGLSLKLSCILHLTSSMA